MLKWLFHPWRRLRALWHYRQLRVLMTERRETVEAWRAHGHDPTTSRTNERRPDRPLP